MAPIRRKSSLIILGVGYDTLAQQTSITAAYAGEPGASFTTYGLDPNPWMGHGGLGLVSRMSKSLQLTAQYDLDAQSGFTDQIATMQLLWEF